MAVVVVAVVAVVVVLSGKAVAGVLLGVVHLDEVGRLALQDQVGDKAGSRGGPEEGLDNGVLGAEDHNEEGEEEEEEDEQEQEQEQEEAGHNHAGAVLADKSIPEVVDVEPLGEDTQVVTDDSAAGLGWG